jgi:hypothetical protein
VDFRQTLTLAGVNREVRGHISAKDFFRLQDEPKFVEFSDLDGLN